MRGLSPAAASWGCNPAAVWASHCVGFHCCTAPALGVWASAVVALRLQWPRSMWGLLGPGNKPMFPELACAFLITVPSQKSNDNFLKHKRHYLRLNFNKQAGIRFM